MDHLILVSLSWIRPRPTFKLDRDPSIICTGEMTQPRRDKRDLSNQGVEGGFQKDQRGDDLEPKVAYEQDHHHL